VSFRVGHIDLVANTGTYLDAPFRYHAGGADIVDLPVEWLVDVPAICPDAYGQPVVSVRHLGEPDRWGKAVLVHIGWSKHWGTERYRSGSPHLSEEAATSWWTPTSPCSASTDSTSTTSTTPFARFITRCWATAFR
jgi:kynurenine formamidase